ncbi:MAG: metallophosphoesterase [Clostridia bacterium]|nr:metallophosphoesterase [Clostridia bacterium]
MAIYAIGDLHLSLSVDKPMDIFGDRWVDYVNKIKEGWLEQIKDEDLVLLPGDTSWAMNLGQAEADFIWLDELPGKKIITRGNHDYWWGTLTKMNGVYESLTFVQNSYEVYEDWAICGSRGWISPNTDGFSEDDLRIYERELHRLELSLSKAAKDGFCNLIVMLHYPPTNDQKEYSKIQELLEKYKVKHVVYGHLHTQYCWHLSLQGLINEVHYHMVSSDFLNFVPKKIIGE